MKHIEAQDGDNIAITIQDIFVQKTHPKEGDSKIIVKVIGTTEDGETGESTLWLTDEIWQGETKSSVTKALELLESLGMENGDIRNMATLIGKDATFRASVKGDKVNFYLRSAVDKIEDLDEAAKLIEAIRGKAAAQELDIAGTPVDGGDAW